MTTVTTTTTSSQNTNSRYCNHFVTISIFLILQGCGSSSKMRLVGMTPALRPTFSRHALRAAEQFSYTKIHPKLKFIQSDRCEKHCTFPQQKQMIEKPVGWRWAFNFGEKMKSEKTHEQGMQSYRFCSLRPRPHVSGYFWIRNIFFKIEKYFHPHVAYSNRICRCTRIRNVSLFTLVLRTPQGNRGNRACAILKIDFTVRNWSGSCYVIQIWRPHGSGFTSD